VLYLWRLVFFYYPQLLDRLLTGLVVNNDPYNGIGHSLSSFYLLVIYRFADEPALNLHILQMRVQSQILMFCSVIAKFIPTIEQGRSKKQREYKPNNEAIPSLNILRLFHVLYFFSDC